MTSLSCYFSGKHLREADRHSTHCGVSLQPLFAGGLCLYLNEEEPLFKFRPVATLSQQILDTEQVSLPPNEFIYLFIFFLACVTASYIKTVTMQHFCIPPPCCPS